MARRKEGNGPGEGKPFKSNVRCGLSVDADCVFAAMKIPLSPLGFPKLSILQGLCQPIYRDSPTIKTFEINRLLRSGPLNYRIFLTAISQLHGMELERF